MNGFTQTNEHQQLSRKSWITQMAAHSLTLEKVTEMLEQGHDIVAIARRQANGSVLPEHDIIWALIAEIECLRKAMRSVGHSLIVTANEYRRLVDRTDASGSAPGD